MGQVLQDAVNGIKSEAQNLQWKLDLAAYLEKIGLLEDYEVNLNKTIETNKKNVKKSQDELDKARADAKQKFNEFKADLDKQIDDAKAEVEKQKELKASVVQTSMIDADRILTNANNKAAETIDDAKNKQKVIQDKLAKLDAAFSEKQANLASINVEIDKRSAILDEMKSKLEKL